MRPLVIGLLLIGAMLYTAMPTRFSYYWEKNGQAGFGYFTVYDPRLWPPQYAIKAWESSVAARTGDSSVVVLSWQKVWSAKDYE